LLEEDKHENTGFLKREIERHRERTGKDMKEKREK
jgi:hypothetical protein